MGEDSEGLHDLADLDANRLRSPLPTMIDPRRYQPPLPLPGGLQRAQIVASLERASIDGSQGSELQCYAREDCDRFLYTLDLVPESAVDVLEVGANPYFTTALLLNFRPRARLHLVNYFGGEPGTAAQTLQLPAFDGNGVQSHRLEYLHANLEAHRLPLPDRLLDVVLYCEVIEHLLNDPLASLLELKRLLRPDGLLIVTTPNVARLENLARMVAGANLYDPYSGYGPYGRHNREYTRHELHRLLEFCGFTQEVFFSADVHDNRAGGYCDLSALQDLVAFRAPDLGQYLFCRYRNTGAAPQTRPGWLYRSYAQDQLDPTPL
ncbi:MAG: hypothetical protein JWQ90_4492 [Hydrocarboniphaga sp.]|uniref:class I SAM-dependent methyltransferase n=1 Tax=Hydrocarboniphaga sp. TaxID=2033016 RepID=UPI002637D79D|nr:class I SAM-dependent methyltransferase [Hydrocarboniphaga sp.]MDB5972042.1 hypothetical protein [Hydrocarboniphaga sp.]